MSDGIAEMEREKEQPIKVRGKKYVTTPEQNPDNCEGCALTNVDRRCIASLDGIDDLQCQTGPFVYKESPLATAAAELASQGRPLVAESIIRGAKEAIIAEGVRTFDTGATRDTDEGKLDIEAFFSPLVTKRRAEYMHLHRKLGDGSMRDGDNWQLGMPYSECLKSLCRHVEDIKLLSRGYDAREDIETALCAVMFNCESMLLTRLENKP